MRRIAIPFVIFLATLAASTSAFGWLNTGHRIVADVAWAELTPAARTWATDLLKHHPRYQEDLLLDLPNGAGDVDTAPYAFATAATWPDLVRSQTNPMHAAYSHPAWHYIDIPYSLGGQQPATQPAYSPGRDGPAGPKDIVEALHKNVADLKDPQVSPADKAVALCWVLHLCGDIHQPLHCCNMYSAQFPDGDKGGNIFMVLRDPPYADSRANLHFIWDNLPGDYQSRDLEQYIAAGLRADPRYARDQLKSLLAVTDFSAWANESHALAIQFSYANGELRGAAKGVRAAPGAATPGLTREYLRDAEHVADKQLILAGYRTADLLNSLTAGAAASGAK